MYMILIFMLIIKIVLGDDESYEKYIDLLPEEEKQQFLERIARRILEGIKTEKLSDPNKPNVEMSDAQLDAQDSYVQDILKEETEKLEDEKRQEDSLNGDENGDENKYIDLTLREGNIPEQDIETETTTEFPYNVIPVKPIYDDPNDDPSRNVNNESKENISMRIKHETNDYSNASESNNNTTLELTEYNSSQESLNDTKNQNLRKSFQSDIFSIETSTDVDQNFSESNVVTEDYNKNSETTTNTVEENISNATSDNVIEINNLTSNENDSIKEANTERQKTETTTIESDVATTVSIEEPKTLNGEEDNTEHESTTWIKLTEESITTYNHINPNQKFQQSGVDEIIISTDIPIDYNKTNTDISELKTKLTENDRLNKSNSENDTEITQNTEIEITTGSSNISTTNKSEDVKNATQANEGSKSEEKVSELKKDLHLRSSFKQSKEEIVWSKTESKLGKEKTYEVFEVAAEKPPFKLLKKVETDQPKHYVPIYDYAPENAYFRPYERFGPDFRNLEQENIQNILDDKIILTDDEKDYNLPQTRSRFSSYNNKENRQYRLKDTHYTLKKGNSDMYAFMKPVQTRLVHSLYNPYDYFDIDYANSRYILRSANEPNLKHFPDSKEDDHPYNSIHKSDSVKDHVRAVRKILYLQKRFGYVPEIEKEMRKFDQHPKTNTFLNKKSKEGLNKEPVKDKISVDYYYERANPREDSENFASVNVTDDEIVILPKEIVGEFNAVLYRNDKKHSRVSNNKLEREKGKFSSFFDAMVEVLADMLRFDNEALEGYDWLKTSVDIQSGIRKLLDLTDSLKYGREIHPKDLELLKYCLYLYKSGHMSLHKYGRQSKKDHRDKRRKKKGLLPKSWKKNKNKQKPLMQWKDFAKFIRNHVENEQKLKILYDFEDFLGLILYHLNDFHDALKHIAMITKYNDQKWYLDLKRIYFKDATKKQLGNVLLHLSIFTLLDHIEEDAGKISEVNFKMFVQNNSKDVKSTKKDFVFALQVLDELNRINVL